MSFYQTWIKTCRSLFTCYFLHWRDSTELICSHLNQSRLSFSTGGVVWRIRASDTRLVCAAGSRNGTEETKLLVLDFDVDDTAWGGVNITMRPDWPEEAEHEPQHGESGSTNECLTNRKWINVEDGARRRHLDECDLSSNGNIHVMNVPTFIAAEPMRTSLFQPTNPNLPNVLETQVQTNLEPFFSKRRFHVSKRWNWRSWTTWDKHPRQTFTPTLNSSNHQNMFLFDCFCSYGLKPTIVQFTMKKTLKLI